MEYEFDKEIDSLLRQAQRETYVSPASNAHLDADEISLFAENALMNKARTRATEHLADCSKCRKILSNVIALNAEEPSENLHTAEPALIVTESAVPWYRKLFAFPQLAYTMGGLTVLLAGMIGYVTLQSYNESRSTSIAQMERSIERPRGTTGAGSEGDSMTVETYSANSANKFAVSANSSVSIANAASNSAAAKPEAPVLTANSNSGSLSRKDEPSAVQPAPAPVTENNSAERERNSESKSVDDKANYSADAVTSAGSQSVNSQNSVSRNQTIMPDSRGVELRRTQNLPMVTQAPRSVAQATPQLEEADAPKEISKKKAEAEKAKSVGGKSFIYKDNAWYDKAYKQQKTTNVSRNSDEYKKLDSGLRSVADNLGGTVVIVWNGKAYRIQ